MIGSIAAWLAGAGLSQRTARQIAITILIAIAIVALWIALAWRDARMVAAHDAGKAAAQAQADRAADAGAATRRRADDARLEAEADALERITENVSTAQIPLDPRDQRRAYYACIRVQQQARAAGRLAPAC